MWNGSGQADRDEFREAIRIAGCALRGAGVEWIPADQPPVAHRNKDGVLINYIVFMPEYGTVDIGNYLPEPGVWVVVGMPVTVSHWAYMPRQPYCAESRKD